MYESKRKNLMLSLFIGALANMLSSRRKHHSKPPQSYSTSRLANLTQADQHKTQTGKELTYDQYVNLLLSAASAYDAQFAPKAHFAVANAYSHLETTRYIILGDWYLMAAFTRQHLLPFGNYTLHYLADPSLERMGSDKKNKGIGSQETRDCVPGSSLRSSLAIFIYGDCGSSYSSYKSY
jgi:hypothetical protein